VYSIPTEFCILVKLVKLIEICSVKPEVKPA